MNVSVSLSLSVSSEYMCACVHKSLYDVRSNIFIMNFSPAGNLLVAFGTPVSCRLQFLNRQTLRKMKDVFLSNVAPDQHDWTRNEERSADG